MITFYFYCCSIWNGNVDGWRILWCEYDIYSIYCVL